MYLTIICNLYIIIGSNVGTIYERDIQKDLITKSHLFQYYKDIMNNEKVLEEYILQYIKNMEKPLIFKSKKTTINPELALQYIKCITRISLEILTNEKLDFLLYIFTNTISEIQKIGEISPFSYIVIHHVNRMYRQIINENVLRELISQKSSSLKLREHFENIMNPYKIRPTLYVNATAIEMGSNIKIKNIKNEERLKTLSQRILDIEMIQLYYDIYNINKDCKRSLSTDIFSNILRLSPRIEIEEKNKNIFLLFQEGSLYFTRLAYKIGDFETYKKLIMPFRSLNYIIRMSSITNDYIMKLDYFYENINQIYVVNKFTMEIYLAFIMFYSRRHDVKIIIQIKSIYDNNYEVTIRSITMKNGDAFVPEIDDRSLDTNEITEPRKLCVLSQLEEIIDYSYETSQNNIDEAKAVNTASKETDADLQNTTKELKINETSDIEESKHITQENTNIKKYVNVSNPSEATFQAQFECGNCKSLYSFSCIVNKDYNSTDEFKCIVCSTVCQINKFNQTSF